MNRRGLEEHLDMRLPARTTRSVAPTAAGARPPASPSRHPATAKRWLQCA
ncbi:LysR family transcriptional regulator [Neorhizobium galegae]|nr:LysR family transcriptional regulator [Neorhizobium galegae]